MEQQAVEVRMGQTHLGFVDAAKGLGMLAIIWGHMDYLWSTSSVWFSSFKIAVFYVVVGLLKAYRYGERGQRDSCAQVMKKRWYSLVIPYGVFSALAILAHLAFLTIHGGSRLAALKGDVILTVTLRGVATLWFLPTLLIAELLFAAVRPEGWSAAKRILVCVLAPAILCVVGYFYQEMDIPGADRLWVQVVRNLFIVLAKSVSGFWFMLCGYLLSRRGKPQRLGRLPVLAVLLAVNLGLSLLSPDLDFNSFKLGSFAPVFYLNGVLGSVAVLELLRWLEARPALKKLVIALNRWLPAVPFACYPLLLVLLNVRWFRLLSANRAAALDFMQLIARAVFVPAFVFLGGTLLRARLNFPRPYEQPGFTPLVPKETHGKSFPSRHALSAAVLAAVWCYFYPAAGACMVVVALLICALRVLAGAHYVRDVAAGALLGFALGAAGMWLL